MKSKLELKMKRHFDALEEITKMISAHNAGEISLDLDVFEGFLMAKKAIYPSTYKNISFETHTDVNVMDIFDNKGWLCSIELQEIQELEEAV